MSPHESLGGLASPAGVSGMEFESLRQERDMLRQELTAAKMAAEILRMERQVREGGDSFFFLLLLLF